MMCEDGAIVYCAIPSESTEYYNPGHLHFDAFFRKKKRKHHSNMGFSLDYKENYTAPGLERPTRVSEALVLYMEDGPKGAPVTLL